ncbi:hypothetical protein HPB51_000388 [Rhipicephalus microplus]|uniref:Uncharacterized protein n=1 Tax=Rhipicephalus microplus TaxID=6941 RepID=A0A9J6D1A0_RHIMP|nr:hypothetical protein HPB51_027085 [Rhipicephalus microplus]KAH8008643.1 hypothetical protein HPB51_000388 [Rhipicephalus microplus]
MLGVTHPRVVILLYSSAQSSPLQSLAPQSSCSSSTRQQTCYLMTQIPILHENHGRDASNALANRKQHARSLQGLLSYVCYNYFDVHTENAYFNAVQSPHLVLQGISSNAAGRALFAYYRSCIFSQRDPADSLKEALRALLQVMYVSLDMTSLQMLVLVIKLSLYTAFERIH